MSLSLPNAKKMRSKGLNTHFEHLNALRADSGCVLAVGKACVRASVVDRLARQS